MSTADRLTMPFGEAIYSLSYDPWGASLPWR